MQHNEIILYNDELVSWRFHWTTSYRPPCPNFYGLKFFESSIAGNWKANFESFFSNDDESSKLMSHWNGDSFLLLGIRKSLHRTDTNNFQNLISKKIQNVQIFTKNLASVCFWTVKIRVRNHDRNRARFSWESFCRARFSKLAQNDLICWN